MEKRRKVVKGKLSFAGRMVVEKMIAVTLHLRIRPCLIVRIIARVVGSTR